jgi:uncharacterized protein YbaR (Trm112 family)
MAGIAGPKREAAEGRGLTREDLAWLVCPVCRSALELYSGQTGASVVVRCTGCDRRYPVADGLPVLLADRAALASATNV